MLNKPRCYITSLKDEKDRKRAKANKLGSLIGIIDIT